MEAIEYCFDGIDQRITIEVPKSLHGKRLKVILMEDESNEAKKFQEMLPEERLKVLEQYKGTAKYPDFPIDKYDVYNQ